ncbi:hypothetical protein AXG93_1593s1620 [Marchantia polymorpha subsp. ruderalis]|uniref:Uncharacterized protein n=1 Tax=Marchantia polymorpha subsp. ruderalis TaxID=1480154 RepID=A0A176WNM8_MARPO|nr:hypothetical protein AXG93_1593s1620 [Marchantia polymorpha subsp. ruderalis]
MERSSIDALSAYQVDFDLFGNEYQLFLLDVRDRLPKVRASSSLDVAGSGAPAAVPVAMPAQPVTADADNGATADSVQTATDISDGRPSERTPLLAREPSPALQVTSNQSIRRVGVSDSRSIQHADLITSHPDKLINDYAKNSELLSCWEHVLKEE